MSRFVKRIPLKNVSRFSQQLLKWVQTSDTFIWLDSNDYPQKYSSFHKALAIGVKSELKTNYHQAFEKLNRYQQQKQDYIFGYLSYDLKNDTENLKSTNFDELEFPDIYFFQPLKVFLIHGQYLEMHYDDSCIDEIDRDLLQIQNNYTQEKRQFENITIKARISEYEYYQKIDKIQRHIRRGDTYETNFCMEYFSEDTRINPLLTYTKLNAISKPPFAVFFKNDNHYLLSASPERFVRKEGNKIISQPIKGTIKRSTDHQEDKALIEKLKNDPKERSENIMIVDLVRNDLSKTATKSSVKVEELCEVYSFKQVHQLISTITSTVKKDVTPVHLLKSLFPMGSMTGAPKIATMKIIEEQEVSKRGVYSGAVGYFTPKGDFDFNVVIRSILYNVAKKYVSFSVGGAITAKSNPQQEYQECTLKAAAMINALKNKS